MVRELACYIIYVVSASHMPSVFKSNISELTEAFFFFNVSKRKRLNLFKLTYL